MSAFRVEPVARCWVAGGLVLCALLAWPGTAGAAPKPPPPLDTVVVPDLGPGYSVTTEGPLDASQFASDSPDPAAATMALATLAKTISTYERVWRTSGGANEVQDLLVRFPSAVGAQVFEQAARHSLDSGEIVSSGPLPGVPGAHRTTYFASTSQAGVGQAITMRAGIYVDLLSFFSAAAANAAPITPGEAVRVARDQVAAMSAAPGGAAQVRGSTKSRVSLGSIVLAAVSVAVVALAVATPALLRRRRSQQPQADEVSAAATSAPPG